MVVLHRIFVRDWHKDLRLLGKHRRFNRSETVVVRVGPMHRLQERKDRRVEQVPMVQILEQAERNAKCQSPGDDHSRMLKFGGKNQWLGEAKQGNCNGQLEASEEEELGKRHMVMPVGGAVVGGVQR